MDKHSEAPWELEEIDIEETGELVAWKVSAGDVYVADVHVSTLAAAPLEQCRANAHLIAAAPDLLEAAECIREALDQRKRYAKPRLMGEESLRAAIRKARGES